ncbi:MAG: ArsC/Spx/MgsR family protein [Myxococcota bacterium]
MDILRERDVEFDVINYLENPLSRADIEGFFELLPGAPAELVRKDKNFKALELDADAYQTPEAVIALLLEHPKLMQRPIVIRGQQAVIARPSEKVLELLE